MGPNGAYRSKASLRPTKFIPTFHKYKNEVCIGLQLHFHKDFHSLLYSIELMKLLYQDSKADFWRAGSYEFGSDKTAIEILAGDALILKI